MRLKLVSHPLRFGLRARTDSRHGQSHTLLALPPTDYSRLRSTRLPLERLVLCLTTSPGPSD